MSGSCPPRLQLESQVGVNSSCSEVFETSSVLVIIKHLGSLELTIPYRILEICKEGKSSVFSLQEKKVIM